MNIRQFIDSTYLKSAKEAGISEAENIIKTKTVIQEAIDEHYKLVMIRPELVSTAKKMIQEAKSKLEIGTVIDFPKGNSTIEKKMQQAQVAIENGADDLDFVCNYNAFKKGQFELVKNEIFLCTQLGLAHHKNVKWIIEIAALNNKQIIQLSTLIKNVVISNFKEEAYASVFVKSSTGFYKTKNKQPNGATLQGIIMMLENASPLSIKAAGGIKSYEDVAAMIRLGVKRIGTSSAKTLVTDAIGISDLDAY